MPKGLLNACACSYNNKNNYFFRAKFISISYLLRIDSSSGQLRFLNNYFFGGELDQKKDIYWRASFSKQVVLHTIRLFQNSYFFNKGTTSKHAFFKRATISRKEPLQKRSFLTTATFSVKVPLQKRHFSRTATFWRKLIFQESNISHHLLFLESYFFRAATFPKDLTFIAATFSEKLLFYYILFQKVYCLPATLPCYSSLPTAIN